MTHTASRVRLCVGGFGVLSGERDDRLSRQTVWVGSVRCLVSGANMWCSD